MARRVGFEPTTSASEARRTIQLCYRRLGVMRGIEPSLAESQSAVLPLHQHHHSENCQRRRCRKMVWVAGFEPAASRFQTEDSDRTELHPVMVGRGSGREVFMRAVYHAMRRSSNRRANP